MLNSGIKPLKTWCCLVEIYCINCLLAYLDSSYGNKQHVCTLSSLFLVHTFVQFHCISLIMRFFCSLFKSTTWRNLWSIWQSRCTSAFLTPLLSGMTASLTKETLHGKMNLMQQTGNRSSCHNQDQLYNLF